MADLVSIPAKDHLPVGSRISWGAILAGAVTAIAAYFVLTLLGGAIGLSVSGDVQAETLGISAAIWAIASTILALLLGGWIVSQLSVGETKKEAAIHGVIMWGVVFALLLWLVASGVRSGFTAMVGMTNVASAAAQTTNPEDWQAAARQAGVSQEQIQQWQNSVASATDQVTQEEITSNAAAATWWTLLGVLLSMGAAIGGAVLGAGPSFKLLGAHANVPTTSYGGQQPAPRA